MSAAWINDTLARYGAQLGLPSLALDETGVAQLALQAGGMLAVEPVPGGTEVLVYLGRPVGFDGPGVLRRALALAHHASALPMPVQVALSGDGPDALLLVLVRVPERELTEQALVRAVEYLGRWTDGVRNG